MANIEDYLPGGEKDPNKTPVDGINEEITDAQGQQQQRQEATQQQIDWEQRYKELEKLNSRQAQTLGEYKRAVDEIIISPTPTEAASPEANESPTISEDEWFSDPAKAVSKAVEAHPDVREARKLKEEFTLSKREKAQADFMSKHSDVNEIVATPEFQNWVVDNPTRTDLLRRADAYDFNAADALFSLYKAEKGMQQVTNRAEIEEAELVNSSGEMVVEPPKYSRTEYIQKLTRSRQGDLEAEDWVKRNSAGYRMALASGNVRD